MLKPPPPPPELFAERPVSSDFARSDFARRRPPYAVRRVITLLVLAGLIGGSGYYYLYRAAPTTPGEIPTVKADGNYKQKPEQPGGIDIPHQDVEVYKSLDPANTNKPEVEHLLPPPEVPQPPAPSTTTNVVPAKPVTTELESLMSPSTPVPQVETTVTTPAALTPTSAPEPLVRDITPATAAPAPQAAVAVPPVQTEPVVVPAPVVPPAPPPPAVPHQTTITVSKGHTAVQLASIPDQASATQAMAQLQHKYATQLGWAQLHLVKADLGAKGIYYRIQSQSLSEDQARGICSALKNLNAGCFLVRQ